MSNVSAPFHILLLNVRSLRHKTSELQLFIQEFETKNNINLDILALTETWAKVDEAPMLQIDGYSLHLQERSYQRGGGVAMYVRNGIVCDIVDLAASTQNVIKFRIVSSSAVQLNGLLIYRAPKSNREQFYSELLEFASDLGEPAIVLGDMNIDILKENDSTVYLNLLTSLGYESHINCPTREVGQHSTCIDHIFFRNKMKLKNTTITSCYTTPCGLTDHHAVLVDISGLSSATTVEPATRKVMRKYTDWESLNTSLASVDWDLLLGGGCVDSIFDLFIKKINELVSNHTKFFRRVPWKHKRNPWASVLLIRLSKQKNDLYRLVKKFPNNPYLKQQYKNVSRKVQLQISNDKKNYFGKLLEDAGPNSRKYWNIVNSATGRVTKGIDRITSDSVDYEITGNESTVASIFNKHFTGVTRSLLLERELLSPPSEHEFTYTSYQRHNPNSMFFFPVTTHEVFDAIKGIANKNSVGVDGMEVGVLKNCVYSLLYPLQILFNASVSQGIFPNKLKTAVVVPIFKSGDRTNPSDYRPIAILPVLSKVLELIIKNRLLAFLTNSNFFSERQFGFLPNRSTDDALLSHITDIVSLTERGSMAVALYLDISKAFDTVDHDILLDKLHTYGIRGVTLSWFSTYLKDRYQVVRIREEISSPLKITSGVPQGSTLGPLLFLIYVNELLNLKITGRIYSFADDTSVLFSANNKSELIKKINDDLRILTVWFVRHKLYPNLKKTKIISYGPQNIDLKETLKLHSIPNCQKNCTCSYLDQVTETKYLGLTLDRKLNWAPHTTSLQSRIRKLNYMLYHTSKFLKRAHLIRIYKAMYEPVLRYGIIHWGHAPKRYTQPLKILQKYAIRIIAGIRKQDHTSEYFNEFNLLNFDQTYKLFSAKYAHRHFDTFGLIEHSASVLRDRGKILYRPNWRKDCSRAQAAYSIPTIFNALPLEVRDVAYHGQFTNCVRRIILSNGLE